MSSTVAPDKLERVQLKRTKGWRIPANTVKVDRTTKWGNPFVPGKPAPVGPLKGTLVADVRHSFVLYRSFAPLNLALVAAARASLALTALLPATPVMPAAVVLAALPLSLPAPIPTPPTPLAPASMLKPLALPLKLAARCESIGIALNRLLRAGDDAAFKVCVVVFCFWIIYFCEHKLLG